VVADVATANHETNPVSLGLRRRVNHAAPKIRIASAIPLRICSFQSGKLLIGTPGGYFSVRGTEWNKPQDPPTVPSISRFHDIIGLEQVDAEILAPGKVEHLRDHPGLVDTRRQR
jgi:hypothetical protein